MLDATGMAEAVKTEVAARTRVKVRILIDSVGKNELETLMRRWR